MQWMVSYIYKFNLQYNILLYGYNSMRSLIGQSTAIFSITERKTSIQISTRKGYVYTNVGRVALILEQS